MISQKEVFGIVKTMVGSNDIVAVNMSLVRFTGFWPAGLMLSQLLFWADKTKIPGGWVCKTFEDWEQELMISDHQVRKATKLMERMGILETMFKKFDGTPKNHYKIKEENFTKAFMQFLKGGKIRPLKNSTLEVAQSETSLEGAKSGTSIKEIESKTEIAAPAEATAPRTPNSSLAKKESKAKEEPAHQDFVDAYWKWYEAKAGQPPRLLEQDYKALKNIRKYLTDVKKGDGQAALHGWLYILEHWAELENFLQKQVRPAQIDSNMANILLQIRERHKEVAKSTVKVASMRPEQVDDLFGGVNPNFQEETFTPKYLKT